MKKILFLVLCALSVMGAKAQDMEGMQLPTDPSTKIGRLENGLTYYIRHNEFPKGQANFYIAQKVGSSLEEDNQRGLAHFLEHMCFNGTKNFPGNGVIRYLESIGVKFGEQLNAYTSIDETVYNINNVPTAKEGTIDSCLLILHDWSHDLALDPAEIDKERGVIHEEWRMTSSATMRILERQLPKLMSETRLGYRLPIGTMEVVDHFKPEALRAYYEKWYRPDQQAIIVVGDLDVAHVEEKIKELFAPIQMPANPAERTFVTVPDNVSPIVVSDKDKEQSMTMVEVMMKHPQLVPDEMKNSLPGLLTKVLSSLAQQMINSRLEEMTQKPDVPFLQAAVEDGDFIMSKKTQALTTLVVPKEGETDKAMQAVMAEVYRAARFGFTPTEYQRTRSEFMSQVESAYQNRDKRQSDTYIQECVRHFIDGEPMPGLETEYQLCNAVLPSVEVETVNELFRQLVSLTDTNLVILAFNPDKEGFQQPTEEQLLANVHAAQQMELTPYVDNVKDEPLIAELPAPGHIVKEKVCQFGFTEMTLSNGAKVYMKKTDYKDNEILMSAYSRGGVNRFQPADRYTLANINLYLGASGLGNFTSNELQKALAGKQASCSASLSAYSEGLSGKCVPRDIRTLFEVAYLHFQPLHRDDAAMQSAMNSLRQSLHNRHAEPMTAFQDSIQTTLYDHNPNLVILEEEDLEKCSYDRALEIYTDRFADASDFNFYFIGNLNEDSIRAYACQYLATLPTVKRNDKPVESNIKFVGGIRENIFQQKQEQPQCYAFILSFAKGKKDVREYEVADFLGETLNMRYLEVIREEMGAAYSTQASAHSGRATLKDYRTLLQVVLPLKPELCDSALKVVDEILEDVAQNGVAEKYLSKIREYKLKNIDEAEHLNGSWLSWFRGVVEEKEDGYTGMRELIQGIESKDLARMAQQLLKAKNKITVVMMPEK